MDTCPVAWMIDPRNAVQVTCVLQPSHDGPHVSPGGGIEWDLTAIGEAENQRRAERDRHMASPEYRARLENDIAATAESHQRFIETIRRKQSTRRSRGQANLDAGGFDIAYCRTPDILDEHQKRLNQPKTHILNGDKLASGHQIPSSAFQVVGPDDNHPLCKSCVEGLAKHA